MFMITIGNLLRFLEYMYFNDKTIFIKNFALGFVKVCSTHFSFGFLHKCKRFEIKNVMEIFSAILNLIM